MLLQWLDWVDVQPRMMRQWTAVNEDLLLRQRPSVALPPVTHASSDSCPPSPATWPPSSLTTAAVRGWSKPAPASGSTSSPTTSAGHRPPIPRTAVGRLPDGLTWELLDRRVRCSLAWKSVERAWVDERWDCVRCDIDELLCTRRLDTSSSFD